VAQAADKGACSDEAKGERTLAKSERPEGHRLSVNEPHALTVGVRDEEDLLERREEEHVASLEEEARVVSGRIGPRLKLLGHGSSA
jgi:hypothetical protein